jgi:hypothetical protein
VQALLEQIPAFFSEQQKLDACLGAAVDACIQVLKLGTGGKLQMFASTLPKVGKGALTQREQGRPATDSETQKAQEPASKHYRDMAADAAYFQVPCCGSHPPATAAWCQTPVLSVSWLATWRLGAYGVAVSYAVVAWSVQKQLVSDMC